MMHDGALDLDAMETELADKNVPMSQVRIYRRCLVSLHIIYRPFRC